MRKQKQPKVTIDNKLRPIIFQNKPIEEDEKDIFDFTYQKDVLNEAITRVQPPSDKGRRLKVYYMTQASVAPPTFVLFCNSAALFHFSYQRYIENCLRDTFGFRGTPIKLIIRQRSEEDETKI